MKPVRFIGSAKDDISAFPKSVRTRTGYELFMVQVGRGPADGNRCRGWVPGV